MRSSFFWNLFNKIVSYEFELYTLKTLAVYYKYSLPVAET